MLQAKEEILHVHVYQDNNFSAYMYMYIIVESRVYENKDLPVNSITDE